MKAFMEQVKEVRDGLVKVAGEITEDTVLGTQFLTLIACAKLLKDDPGACAATRDAATEGLDAIEQALARAGEAAKTKARMKKTARAAS